MSPLSSVSLNMASQAAAFAAGAVSCIRYTPDYGRRDGAADQKSVSQRLQHLSLTVAEHSILDAAQGFTRR